VTVCCRCGLYSAEAYEYDAWATRCAGRPWHRYVISDDAAGRSLSPRTIGEGDASFRLVGSQEGPGFRVAHPTIAPGIVTETIRVPARRASRKGSSMSSTSGFCNESA